MGRVSSREREHLPGCCVRPGAACDCDLIVDFMVEDAEKEANSGG